MKKAILSLALLLLSGSAFATSVDLTWLQSTTPGVTANAVYRSQTQGGPYTQVFLSNSRIASWIDTTVTTGELYCYVVTAIGPDGESTDSNEACITAGTKAPTNLKAK